MTTINNQRLNKEDFQKALGNKIRQIREAKNISQTELGHLCDIERPNMNRIEAGKTNPSSYLLYVIADKLGVKAAELLNFNSTSE